VPDAAGGPALVSCVVVTYNSAEFVEDAVRSVLAQTHRPIEVVVADDRSEDATRELAAAFGPPVRVVVTDETAGPAATRNFGLRETRGEFVAFLDGDDLWHPDKLVRQLARFAARPELQASIAHVRNFWEEGQDELQRRYDDHRRMGAMPGYATTTLLARRSAFHAVGELESDLWFADALDWFLRARELGVQVELIPDVLTFHRLHPDNLSRRRSRASEDEFLDIIKASLDRRRGRSE
jgi:glycosyltransferase involved in cell wall biosynthesis